MKIIGITGLPGAGKSTVRKILEEKGFPTLNGDEIVHQLYENGGAGAREVEFVFGSAFLKQDGSVDREKLKEEILKNPQVLKTLEDLLKPLVFEKMHQWISRQSAFFAFIEAVYFDSVDYLIRVEAPYEICLRRKGIDPKLFRIFSDAMPKYDVDFVIENVGSEKELKAIVTQIIQKLSSFQL